MPRTTPLSTSPLGPVTRRRTHGAAVRGPASRVVAALAALAWSGALFAADWREAPASVAQELGPPPLTAPPQGDAEVPPRARVAGLDSLRARSHVRFADPAAAPHVLEVSYAFPARARASLRREDGDVGARVLRYRRGSALAARSRSSSCCPR